MDPETGVFVDGREYKVTIYLTPDTGYAFTNSTTATIFAATYESSSASGYVSVNGTSASYTLTAAARHNGYRYRCEVTASNGKSTISNVAYLAVFEGTNSVSEYEIDESPFYGEDFPILELNEIQAELWEAGLLTEEDAQLTVQSGLVSGRIGAEAEAITVIADAEDDLPYDPEIGTEPYDPEF